MEILEKILKEKGGDLVAELTGSAGYTPAEAERFVPEAGRSVGSAIAALGGRLDLDDLASAGNVRAILAQVDVGALAGRAGLAKEKGSTGLATILPLILSFLAERGEGGGLLGLLGKAGEVQDAVDKLKGLGKLF